MTLVFAFMDKVPLPLFYNIAREYSKFPNKSAVCHRLSACDSPLWEDTIGGKLIDHSYVDAYFSHPNGLFH